MLALPDGFAYAAYAGTHATYTEPKGLHAAPPANQRNRNPFCPLPKSVPRRWVECWAHSGQTLLHMSLSSCPLSPARARYIVMAPMEIWSRKPSPPVRMCSFHFHASLLHYLTLWAPAVGPRLHCGVPFSVRMAFAQKGVLRLAMQATVRLTLNLTGTYQAAMRPISTVPKGTRRLLLAC